MFYKKNSVIKKILSQWPHIQYYLAYGLKLAPNFLCI